MGIATEENKTEQRFCILTAVLCAGFFLLFVILDGPLIAKDSQSYLSMNIAREPVYPLFLSFFRTLFGEAPGRNDVPVYLFCAVIVQALINAYAVWKVAVTLFPVSRTGAVSSIFFQFAVSLLNRFVAGRGSMYAETILTESLAMPLYLLFVVRLWKLYGLQSQTDASPGPSEDTSSGTSTSSPTRRFFFNLPIRHLTACAVLTFLLMGLRKQMTVVLLLWGLVSLLSDLLPALFHRTQDNAVRLKRFGLTVLLLFFLLLCNNLFERGYNRVVHGVAVPHTGNSMGLMSTLYYTADETDAALFDAAAMPEETRALAKEILSTCHTKGITKQNLEEGTARYYIDTAGQPIEEGADASAMSLGEHYASSYDVIGYDVCNPVIYAYLEAQGITGTEAQIAYDGISSAICRALLRQKKGDLLQIYAVNLLRGLVSSNARMRRLLVPVSLCFYIVYLLLLWRTPKGNVKRFALFVLLGLLVNVAVVSAMIFPQARYMIYSMGLFYTALAMMAGSLMQGSASRLR